jgi:hypothetical protein
MVRTGAPRREGGKRGRAVGRLTSTFKGRPHRPDGVSQVLARFMVDCGIDIADAEQIVMEQVQRVAGEGGIANLRRAGGAARNLPTLCP